MQNGTTTFSSSIARHGDIGLVLGVIGILFVIIKPLPPSVLDFLLAINITVSLMTLLVVLYTLQPVDFSVFPSLLLVLTLYRLSLNVASTRLILGKGHEGEDAAGGVIKSFGQFVVEGNYVVGLVIFTILLIIQFVVITKGSGRIAEVAARFTLDAMPMKQMSIDTDLNAGLITEDQARQGRLQITNEANFYGAMDGASKFVRGDAIAGLIITAINILGGFVIGLGQRGMQLAIALERYTLLTIGDGLVSQLPALMVSTAAGILISRSSERGNFGRALATQFLIHPRALAASSGALALLSFTPLPTVPFLILSALTGSIAYVSLRQSPTPPELPPAPDEEEEVEPTSIEKAGQLLEVEAIQLNVGYSLIPLVNVPEGGDLLSRIEQIRETLALELGFILPQIRIRDQMDLPPGGYRITIRENEVAAGELRINDFLAMEVGPVTEQIEGTPTQEPTNNQPAMWITADQRERAQLAGYLVIDPASVLATHLIETIKKHADKLLLRQDVQKLIDRVKADHPVLVEEVIPEVVTLGLVQKVLQNLLKEGVSIRDLVTILEALADHATATKDIVLITESVRQNLGVTICRQYLSSEGTLEYIALGDSAEQVVSDTIQETEQGGYQFLAIEPNLGYQLVNAIATTITQVAGLQTQPLIVCSRSIVRAYLRQFLEIQFPTPLPILSLEEIPATVQLREVGRIELT
ncbi:MAG: flagellar biosynthesis protein FlhA [Candidatus Poribacteria bacterium]|nr:flagellar biosynthesis protein FlhA [Candidatus Poribacteria bacterium]